MPTWIMICIFLIGAVFSAKMLYLIATLCALPVTRGALFVPTSSPRIEAALDAVPMNPRQLFVDLGCGHGRVLRAAQRRYGVRALGFEVNLLAYLAAKIMGLGSRDIHVGWGNFWERDLGEAEVVFCYLFPDVMGKLRTKLEAELRQGARIISCNFPLPGWTPIRVLRPQSPRHNDPIYIYRR